MKIGFDAKRYFNNTTGLGNYARWLVNALPQDQLNVVLFQPKRTDKTALHPISYPTGMFKYLPSLWRSRYICKQLEQEQIQIYHGLSNELPYGIHKTAIKSVVTIHDLINLRYPQNYSILDRSIYAHKLKYAAKHASQIVAISDQTKKDIIHYFGVEESRITIIPLSLANPTKGNEITSDLPYILCVSGFSKRKNLENLVKAYKLVPGHTKLILAGKRGDTFSKVFELAKNDNRIEIRNNVSNAELADLYTNALFCVYPSLFEGFGLPILEAFQYGKTVATSERSSMPEVGGKAAVYFDPKNKDSIAKAISYLLVAKNRAAKEKEITERIKKFDSNELISQYVKLYKSLLDCR